MRGVTSTSNSLRLLLIDLLRNSLPRIGQIADAGNFLEDFGDAVVNEAGDGEALAVLQDSFPIRRGG